MTTPTPRRGLSRPALISLIVVGALVVVGGAAAAFGPAFYRDVIVGEAEAAPTISSTPDGGSSSSPAAEAVADFDGAWRAASGTYAGYRVDEVLNGTDITVVGRTEEVTAEVQVSGLAVTDAEITVDVASIATDEPPRDAYFRDNALHVAEFPTATFRLTQPLEAAAEPAPGEETTLDVAGELTIHGVTREVTAQVQTAFDGSTVQVAGSIPVTFADYDVEAPDLGFVSVEPEGFIEFLLILEKA